MIRLKHLPLDSWHTTSEFGRRNYIPNPWHNGVDGRAAVGTPVYAVTDGIVQVAKDNPTGYGLYVVLDHEICGSLYSHLSRFVVKIGQKVESGDVIGYSGNTGQSTGPHLHFEIRFCKYGDFWDRDGDIFLRCIDPLPYIKDLQKRLKGLTVDDATQIVKEKLSLEDKTIDYLVKDYKYGEILITKIAKALI